MVVHLPAVALPRARFTLRFPQLDFDTVLHSFSGDTRAWMNAWSQELQAESRDPSFRIVALHRGSVRPEVDVSMATAYQWYTHPPSSLLQKPVDLIELPKDVKDYCAAIDGAVSNVRQAMLTGQVGKSLGEAPSKAYLAGSSQAFILDEAAAQAQRAACVVQQARSLEEHIARSSDAIPPPPASIGLEFTIAMVSQEAPSHSSSAMAAAAVSTSALRTQELRSAPTSSTTFSTSSPNPAGTITVVKKEMEVPRQQAAVPSCRRMWIPIQSASAAAPPPPLSQNIVELLMSNDAEDASDQEEHEQFWHPEH